MKGESIQNEHDEMEHNSIRKAKPDFERQNIIIGLEFFQELWMAPQLTVEAILSGWA